MNHIRPLFDDENNPLMKFLDEKNEQEKKSEPNAAWLFYLMSRGKALPMPISVTSEELVKLHHETVAWSLDAVDRGLPSFPELIGMKVMDLINTGAKGEDVLKLLEGVARFEILRDVDKSERAIQQELGFSRKKMASFRASIEAKVIAKLDDRIKGKGAQEMEELRLKGAVDISNEEEIDGKGRTAAKDPSTRIGGMGDHIADEIVANEIGEVRSTQDLRSTSIEDNVNTQEKQSSWRIAQEMWLQYKKTTLKFLEDEGLTKKELEKFEQRM